jgi:Arm DNA-binding domain
MAKENFTGARIAAYRCEPGKRQSFFWDAKVSGLGFRVTASGAKACIFERRLHGKSVRITIGGPDHWTLDAARDKAAELGVAMDNGDDPREQEQEKRAAAEEKRAARHREQATTAEAWQAYLEHLRTTISPKTKQPRSPRYLADHKALAALGGEPLKRGKGTTVRGPLADLLEMKLSDLSAKAVAAWLENEARERPTNAAHAYRLLKAFIRWTAGQDGIVPFSLITSARRGR